VLWISSKLLDERHLLGGKWSFTAGPTWRGRTVASGHSTVTQSLVPPAFGKLQTPDVPAWPAKSRNSFPDQLNDGVLNNHTFGEQRLVLRA